MKKIPELEEIKSLLPATLAELFEKYPNCSERGLRNFLNNLVSAKQLNRKKRYGEGRGRCEWVYQEYEEFADLPIDTNLIDLISLQGELASAINFYSQSRKDLCRKKLVTIYNKLGRKLIGENYED